VTAPGGFRGGQARSSGIPSAARGAALIGLAVIAGIVGLQILDDSNPGSSDASVSTSTVATTAPGTTAASPTGRPASQVRVKVYNATGVQGVAQTLTDKLKAAGYNTQTPANLSTKRAGTVVQCRSGFEAEGKALSFLRVPGATAEAFPSNPPDGAGDADCLVIIGTT
jgi:hypothetical protein